MTELLPDELLIPMSAGGMHGPAPVPGEDLTSLDVVVRVQRLKDRFVQVWGHPFWKKYRKEATEDMEFHSGKEQWNPAVRRKLEKERRPVLQINETRPVVNVIVGYERSAAREFRLLPVGPEDVDTVATFGRLVKRDADDDGADLTISEGFKSGVICGMSAFYVGVDYSQDVIHGRPTITGIKQGELCWDPDWQRYDLRDARDVFWHKMVSVSALKAEYPDASDKIDQAMTLEGSSSQPRISEIPAQDRPDAYTQSLPEGLLFYDKGRDEMRVIQCWYQVWKTIWLLVDTAANTVQEVPDEPEVLTVMRGMVRDDPMHSLRLVKRRQRKIETSVIVPSASMELSQGVEFENDDEEYPVVPYIAYREGDEMLGMIRNLKDPQRECNKRRSAMADNVSAHGNIKYKAVRTMMDNPEALEDPSSTSVFWLKSPNAAALTEMSPPSMPDWVVRQDQQAKVEIREISGVNAPLQGIRESDQSGVAIGRLQAQGQIITSELFDNLRRTRRLIGLRFAKRVQQVHTAEETIRLDDSAGDSEFVTFNKQDIDKFGRITILRDVPSLKYDMQITDSPATPTARIATLAMLFEMTQRAPWLIPALGDVMVELMDIPNRGQVLERVRGAMQQVQAAPPGQQPGAPGQQPSQPKVRGQPVLPMPVT